MVFLVEESFRDPYTANVKHFTSQLVLCLSAASSACSSHVSLKGSSNYASPEERKAAFERLHSVSFGTEISVSVNGNSASTSVSHSLVLANGETIHHAGDLLPVLDKNTPSGRKARDADASESNYNLWFWGGTVGLGTIGLVTTLTASDKETLETNSTQVGIGLAMLLGSGISAIFAYHYRSQSRSDTKAAFATYNDSLLSTLDLCVRGGRVQDCAGGIVASDVPAQRLGSHASPPRKRIPEQPEVGSFKLLERPDAATDTTAIVFQYIAAPGVTLKFVARDLGDKHFKDTVSVSVTCEGFSKDQFTDESILALVFGRENRLLLDLSRNVSQLRGGITQETVEGSMSTSDFVRDIGSLESLEFRVGRLVYALPSNAIARLASAANYVGEQKVKEPPSSPVSDVSPSL